MVGHLVVTRQPTDFRFDRNESPVSKEDFAHQLRLLPLENNDRGDRLIIHALKLQQHEGNKLPVFRRAEFHQIVAVRHRNRVKIANG